MLFGRTLGESGLNLGMYLSKMARLIKTFCDLEIDNGIWGFKKCGRSAEHGRLLRDALDAGRSRAGGVAEIANVSLDGLRYEGLQHQDDQR